MQPFGTWGGEPIVQGPPSGTSIQVTRTITQVGPTEPKIESLELEMLEKYIENRELIVAGWLTKMEWYFQLMNYPIDIWVDVITRRMTNAPQAWLDKEL